MYMCPHCRHFSISWRAQLSPPFDGRTTCPCCGARLKIKLKVSNFLIPIYLFGRATLGMLFHLRFDAGFVGETAIAIILCVLQIRLMAYEEVGSMGK